PLLGMLGTRLVFRTPMTQALIAGSILGIAGVVLVFWPEFSHLQADRRTALGSMAAHRNQEAHLPLWQGMAWAMLYGALFSLAIAAASGKPLAFQWTAPYALSLAYLAVLGSVVAFAGYLTLIRRMGVARSGYIGVMVPVVALGVSAVFEGFRWHAFTGLGIAVSVAGNVVVLRQRARTGRPRVAAS